MDLTFFDDLFLGNPIRKWIICCTILVTGLLLNRLIAKLASRLSYRFFRKVSNSLFYSEFYTLFQRPFINLTNLSVVYIAFSQLSFPVEWELAKGDEFGARWVIHTLFTVTLIWLITVLFLRASEFMEFVYHNLENARISKDLATFLKELSRVLIFTFSFFTVLGKAFEVNITALITSLGIGGLAIALAAQDTLANLIGSFIIYLDRPFQVGDIIELGEIKGVVERIGFRTTRIRTMDKFLLIVPNKKIVDSNLTNITLSNQRRVRFTIGLTYQSTPDKILRIIDEVKRAISDEAPKTSAEMTVRFADFDTSSLNLIVVYYVNSNEYEDMIEVKEKINVKIIEIVKRNGCDFAYPSQTIFLAKQD